ncbi:MAG: hypothetical protein VKL42_12545 [Snowella sp.]|nr:hypothetical protein [Snowella sp.]
MTIIPNFPAAVDTIERRLIVTASLLKTAAIEASVSDQETSIDKSSLATIAKVYPGTSKNSTVDDPIGLLTLDLTFYYDLQRFMATGCNAELSIFNYTENEVIAFDEFEPSDSLIEEIPEIPDGYSLEQLFLSDLFILAASTFPDMSRFEYKVFEGKNQVVARAFLPFDYAVYFQTKNYAQSCIKTFDAHVLSL